MNAPTPAEGKCALGDGPPAGAMEVSRDWTPEQVHSVQPWTSWAPLWASGSCSVKLRLRLMRSGSQPPPGPAPAVLTSCESEILGRQAGELVLRAAAHPSSGASRPGMVLEEAPGGPWAGPARGRGSQGLGKAGVQRSWVMQGDASCCCPPPSPGNLCGGKFRRPSGGRTCPLPWGLHAFPLPWETSFRGPSPMYKWG